MIERSGGQQKDSIGKLDEHVGKKGIPGGIWGGKQKERHVGKILLRRWKKGKEGGKTRPKAESWGGGEKEEERDQNHRRNTSSK